MNAPIQPASPDSRSGPIRTMFLITSMPVGGAETLLQNLVRRIHPDRVTPMICCLKDRGELGEQIAADVPVFAHLINHKFDVRVAGRLKQLFREERVQAVVTVGAGDKMFWGRLAARWARIPVVLSALHSTGWPDGIGHLNRMLTRITDGFIACADDQARFLVREECLPPEKVFVIPNGIDTEQFRYSSSARREWRKRLGIPEAAPTVGLVAALRPEKNIELFLRAAAATRLTIPESHFVIAGDGPERESLEALTQQTGLQERVHFVGSTGDVPGVLSALDLFSLTSHNEAKPVSILEAMACGRPVVATDVGSVHESVIPGQTGLLVPPGDCQQLAECWVQYLSDLELAVSVGRTARNHVVANSSLARMTDGYADLIEQILARKRERRPFSSDAAFMGLPQTNGQTASPV